MLVQIALSLNIFEPLTYRWTGEPNLKPGQRVVVPVGKRLVTGWVVGTASSYPGLVKAILGIIEEDFLPDQQYLSFARSVAVHYLISLGMVLDYSLSPKGKGIKNLAVDLSGKQKKIMALPLSQLTAMAAKEPLILRVKSTADPGQATLTKESGGSESITKNQIILGDSRLERYQDIAARFGNQGKSVLLVAPDFLTAQYLATHFPQADLYHTETPIREREALWHQYQQGRAGIVIGGLTAAFLPLENLGCIIQERANKRFNRPSYSSILPGEVADIRGSSYKIPILWGSSAYSVKLYHHRNEVDVTDLRAADQSEINVGRIKAGEKGIPARVIEILKTEFLAGKKILVVINKRESTDFLFCAKCNRTQRCPSCRGSLVLTDKGTASCQKCRYTLEEWQVCPRCSSPISVIHDLSISVLKDVVSREISEAGVCTLTAGDLKSISRALSKIGEASIVIATPAIINPFFQDKFAAIIYLKPESAFNMNQHHAAEMIFATIADMKEMMVKGGQIYLFSAFHFHYAIQFADDEGKFFNRELKYRQWFTLPPFARVYQVEVKDRDLRALGQKMRDLRSVLLQRTKINRNYLVSRKRSRGFFRGAMEVHGNGKDILEAKLMARRDITVTLLVG